MTASATLSIDQGTTSTRYIIFNQKGEWRYTEIRKKFPELDE
ncbi:glycerol kinase [Alkalihalobacillus xiaoxiensis]|uniref:Glycerol kinase n=1 Tax=Shouchella xiaoxiensis TaxID=766895 RepID=A0ABS2SSE1_9BACI|nr:hypothetical protein [Shouchella xiaoxiensis]MBM7837429.1 glycerol kinase [Shouchella xiaoxiensis]